MRHVRLSALLGLLVLLVVEVTAGGVFAADDADLAGPHPDRPLRSVSVPALGGVLVMEENTPYSGASTVWRFSARAHRWERFSLAPSGFEGVGALAYLPDSGTVVMVPTAPGAVAELDLDTREWRILPVPARHPADVTDIVVDTRRGSILAWSDGYDELWAYVPAGNRWRKVDRKGSWPTAAWGDRQHGYTLLTYDRAADRAVLAVIPIPGARPGSTWLFDPSRGRWTRAHSAPPPLNYGYGEWMTNGVYDGEHQRTVLITWGVVATYDSARDRWDVPPRDSWAGITRRADGLYAGPLVRLDHALVVDPDSGQVLMLGGASFVDLPANHPPWDFEWRPDDSVWAYSVDSNTWTRVTGPRGR